jgi:TolB protein
MSDEPFPESSPEFGKSTNDDEAVDNTAGSGSEPVGSENAGAADDSMPDFWEEDDEPEIIFYTSIDDPLEEPFILHEDDLPVQEPLKILLPAWSESTRQERAPRASVPSASEGAKNQFPWRGCLIGAVAVLIVFSLLASSLFSIYWFWNQRNERISEVTALIEGHAGRQAPNGENGSLSGVERQEVLDPSAAQAPTRLPADPVNRIVFVNDNRQIETISPDGGDRRQLTSGSKSYLFPAWSQDGHMIASIGTTINGSGIYVLPDESATEAIEEVHFSGVNSAFYLYWSPNSQQISFLADSRLNGLTLNILDLDGEGVSNTIASGNPLYWNWASDSRNMLIHAGSETADARLGMINNEGWPVTAQIPAPGPFQAPGISQSGRYWAYSQFQAGGTTWVVIDDRQTGEEAGRRHAGSAAFTWSPARDELAFISGDARDSESPWGPLRLMDPQTGDIRLLSAETVVAFFWSPDGRKIVAISVPDSGILGEEFQVRNEKGRRLARLNYGSLSQPAAQLPPHSFRVSVIDVESGEGRRILETGFSTIFMTQFLPYFDQYAFSHQIWSPDSASFVLPLVDGNSSEVTLIDAESGQTTKLADGSIGFWSRQ